jgi:cytochrome c biogenesis protein CcmG/thiol:disulfide interchange protein DsbE
MPPHAGSERTSPLTKRLSLRMLVGAIVLSLFAVACGASDDDFAAAAAGVDPVETNAGGVLVKPPDVLEGGSAGPSAGLPLLLEGAPLTPIVAFRYFDGTQASTAEFAGRPTVVNFWASNCAPCVAEMPEFEAVHRAFADRVDFVGMNTADVGRESAVALAAQTGVTYPLADDTTSMVFREFGGFVMPTTVLLNTQGQVAFTWSGVLTGDELTRLINKHILSE